MFFTRCGALPDHIPPGSITGRIVHPHALAVSGIFLAVFVLTPLEMITVLIRGDRAGLKRDGTD